jgi:hypothetical protein
VGWVQVKLTHIMETVESTPQGRDRKFTDAQLRECLRAGLSQKQIAEKFSATPGAVSRRIKQLNGSTAVAVTSPEESRRFAASTIDAMAELSKNLRVANKLQAACDEWLTDADDPEKYEVGPRAEEVIVTYSVPTPKGFRKEKATLAKLLEKAKPPGFIETTETKHADPRELILKTAAEVRQTINTCAELAKLLADIRVMVAFREATLAEISKADPDAADRIREAIRRSLVLQGLLGECPDVRWDTVN